MYTYYYGLPESEMNQIMNHRRECLEKFKVVAQENSFENPMCTFFPKEKGYRCHAWGSDGNFVVFNNTVQPTLEKTCEVAINAITAS